MTDAVSTTGTRFYVLDGGLARDVGGGRLSAGSSASGWYSLQTEDTRTATTFETVKLVRCSSCFEQVIFAGPRVLETGNRFCSETCAIG